MVVVVEAAKREFKQVPIELLKSPPSPSREIFEDIKALASTIEKHGLLEPILVKKLEGRYGFQVVCGERRLRACREAGLQTVPCIILDGVSEEQVLHFQLCENVARRDLKPFEEFRILEALKDRFNLTNDEIAAKTGLPRSTVGDYLAIARGIPKEYHRMIVRGGHSLQDLTITKAAILARADLPPDKLKEMLDLIRIRGMSRNALAKKLAVCQEKKIKRVAASRTYWRELTRSLKEFARYWSDYCRLKESEDVKQYRLVLEVTMDKDLAEKDS